MIIAQSAMIHPELIELAYMALKFQGFLQPVDRSNRLLLFLFAKALLVPALLQPAFFFPGMGQYFVGLLDFREAGGGIGIPGMFVGVRLVGQAAIGLFDLGKGGRGRQLQDVVVIFQFQILAKVGEAGSRVYACGRPRAGFKCVTFSTKFQLCRMLHSPAAIF